MPSNDPPTHTADTPVSGPAAHEASAFHPFDSEGGLIFTTRLCFRSAAELASLHPDAVLSAS